MLWLSACPHTQMRLRQSRYAMCERNSASGGTRHTSWHRRQSQDVSVSANSMQPPLAVAARLQPQRCRMGDGGKSARPAGTDGES